MQSLRDRQIREVLDEDLNINRRVNAITREKVKLSDETVTPRKTRDIEVEVSVDKVIESLNKILETKITALDYLLARITRGDGDIGDAEGRRAFTTIVNNGDFISPYNQLIRLYSDASLSRASKELIKTKFQELKSNIDAILYGLSEGIQYLFEQGQASRDIFQLVRSQAVYEFVNNALYQGNLFKIIEQGDISTSVLRVLAGLSEVQREALKLLSVGDLREQSLLKLPIQTGEDKARLEALEDEIGFKFPDNLRGTLGEKDYETIQSEYGQLMGDITAMDREQLDTWISDIRTEDASLQKLEQFLRRKLTLLNSSKQNLISLSLEGSEENKDPDFEDEKGDLESAYGQDIIAVNKEIEAVEGQLAEVVERRSSIDERIATMQRQYEANIRERTGKFLKDIGTKIKPKVIAPSEPPRPRVTEDGLKALIRGKTPAEAIDILRPMVLERGGDFKGVSVTPFGVNKLIKSLLKVQDEEDEEEKKDFEENPLGVEPTRTILRTSTLSKIKSLKEALKEEYDEEDVSDEEVIDILLGNVKISEESQDVLDELKNKFAFSALDLDEIKNFTKGFLSERDKDLLPSKEQLEGVDLSEEAVFYADPDFNLADIEPEVEEFSELGRGKPIRRKRKTLVARRNTDFSDSRNDIFKIINSKKFSGTV